MAGRRRSLFGDKLEISAADADEIIQRITVNHLEQLRERPFYGSANAICLDGASYELAMASEGAELTARQHSCAGKTELNQTADLLRRIAIKYDPEFAGLLNGLTDLGLSD